MFDFAWSEIALIGVVALIAIGPKDMPVAIKAVAEMIKKARRMAGEFQTHVDEMVREANLGEVRDQISELRDLDIKGTIEKAIDGDGSLRKTFSEDPFATKYTPPVTETPPATEIEAAATTTAEIGVDAGADAAFGAETTPIDGDAATAPSLLQAAGPADPQAPAFIPPSIASPPVPPAFIPPGISPPSV